MRQSTGCCKSAEVHQLSTTWLPQVRLHISGDNTPPPSKKRRRSRFYQRLGVWSPTAVLWRPGLPARSTTDGRGRSNSRLKQARSAGSANCTTRSSLRSPPRFCDQTQEAVHTLDESFKSRTTPSPQIACRYTAGSDRKLPLSARLLRGDALQPCACRARDYRDRADDGSPRCDGHG
jgi:hypothetical protein